MRLIVVCLWLWVPLVLAANSLIANEEQLRQLDLRIQELQVLMHDNHTQYGRLQRQLQHYEEDIGDVAQHLEMLHSALNNRQNALADLKQQRMALQTQLKAQRQVLAQQIRAAYIMGRQDYLKLWLN